MTPHIRRTLPLALPLDAWDTRAQLAIPRRYPSAPAVNGELLDLRDRIDAVFDDRIPTAADETQNF